MEALDWLVIGVFFLAIIRIIVWVVRQKQNDSADYFLGGRDATSVSYTHLDVYKRQHHISYGELPCQFIFN